MSTLKRRIFVGNLPPGTVEADIRKKFHKYGKINSVELKQRGNSSTFAFLDLETDSEKFNACFATLPKKPWNGYEVKLEVAKESFLSRLAKEREYHSITKSSTETHERPAQFQVEKLSRKDSESSPDKLKLDNTNVTVEDSLESSDSTSRDIECKGKLKKFKGTKYFLHRNKDDSSSIAELNEKRKVNKLKETEFLSSSNVGCKGKLKKFKGTKYFLHRIKEDSSSTSESNKKRKVKTLKETKATAEHNIDAEKKPTDLLQRLEMFSDLWKDSFGIQGFHREKDDARNAEAEEKRVQSVAEKRKSFQKQKEVIKMALSNVDSKRNNKKIIFEEGVDTSNYRQVTQSAPDDKSTFPAQKYKLFEDDAEEEIPDFKIRSQFEGKKGQKMLELQSRYAHDERFTLDEKFQESDNEENSGQEDADQEKDEEDEKKNQLKILENVLGHSVEPSSTQKTKAKMTTMLRFDPTKPDHAKFEQKVEKKVKFVLEDPDTLPKAKKKKSEEPKQVSVPVSKDTFYKVSDTLKDALQNKGQSYGFSLRQMFGANEQDSITEKYESTALKKGKKIGWTSNPFKYDSSDSEEYEDVKETAITTPTPAQEDYNISTNTDFHEKFFFTNDDPRFQEGIDFIRNVQRQNQSFADFVKLRRELKQIIRSKVKKIKLKNKPFRKKLGGQKRRMKRKM